MASTLEDAYRNLRIDQPLERDHQLLCTDLFSDLIKSITKKLELEVGEDSKILLSGHTGCGKSTFLNYLQGEETVSENYFVIKYSIGEILNPEDITHVDILLSIGLNALEIAGKRKLKFRKRLDKEIKDLAKLILREKEITHITSSDKKAEVESSLSAGTPRLLQFLAAKFRASFKADKTVRKETRERIKGKTQDLISNINAILSEIQKEAGAPALLLMDDTDKLLPPQSQEIFYVNGQDLAQIRASAIFVVNMDVVCSGKYPAILNKIGFGETFPALKVLNRNAEASPDTQKYRSIISRIFKKRINPKLMSDEVLESLILLSGGIVREAVRIANYAVFHALVNDKTTLDKTDVQSAVTKRRNEHNLTKEKYEILREILEQPEWMPDEDQSVEKENSPFLELINSLALIEYRNEEDKWRRPHPVLVEILKK